MNKAKQRLSAGRARDHPVMEIVPNKALSLSLSLSLERSESLEPGALDLRRGYEASLSPEPSE